MRSPKHRAITGRHVRLPVLLTVVVAAAAVSLSGLVGILVGSAGQDLSNRSLSPAPADVGRPVQPTPAGVAVTDLIVAGGVDEPLRLEVGEDAQMRAQVVLADGTSRDDAPVRWFSSDRAVLAVNPHGLVTGLAPGRARVHAVLPPFDASATVSVGSTGVDPIRDLPPQPDPDHLVALEQRLLDWVRWSRARQGLSEIVVDEARRGSLRALVAHALRHGGIEHVRVDGRQLRAVADGGWGVRLWPVGTPAAWDAADIRALADLIGAEATEVLTDADVAQVSVGLMFDARVSDQLWVGIAVHSAAP